MECLEPRSPRQHARAERLPRLCPCATLPDSRPAQLILDLPGGPMFEDSTFESSGRIRTRSRSWMIAAFAFNGSILLALILFPLIYPEALSRQAFPFLMEVPAPPPPQQPPLQHPAHPMRGVSELPNAPIFSPQKIPNGIARNDRQESAPGGDFQGTDLGSGVPDGAGTRFPSQAAVPQVRLAPNHPVRVSGSIV